MLFQIVQILYWLALSTWFGAVLFLALSAPIILRTVREANPVLPGVLSVNLEGQHGTLLAGTIVGKLIAPLIRLELACAAVLAATVAAQWFFVSVEGYNLLSPLARSALLVLAAALLVYDWQVVFPRLMRHRQKYIDNADDPDVANPELDLFDKYQSDGVTIVRNMLFLLLGMILLSANIRVAGITVGL